MKKWIEKYEPKLILVEGPALADNLIKFLVERDTIPPIAILSLFADTNNIFGLNGILSPDKLVPAKFEAYYPFVSYSPELVALSEITIKNVKSSAVWLRRCWRQHVTHLLDAIRFL